MEIFDRLARGIAYKFGRSIIKLNKNIKKTNFRIE